MTFYIEKETDIELELNYEDILKKVMEKTLETENCPYEASVNLLLTDDEQIMIINSEQRALDKSTDVLSFPVHEFMVPAAFDELENEPWCFEPDSGELLLGDIVISLEHLKAQAESYGHSQVRELAFLIAHSMLHLIGYDHMTEDEEKVMFSKQESILSALNINR